MRGGRRGDQFPFYPYPTSSGLVWRAPAHTPWGTPLPVGEAWFLLKVTKRLRIFRKHHTLGVKPKVQPPLKKTDCYLGRKQPLWQRFLKEAEFPEESPAVVIGVLWLVCLDIGERRRVRNPGDEPRIFWTWVWAVLGWWFQSSMSKMFLMRLWNGVSPFL